MRPCCPISSFLVPIRLSFVGRLWEKLCWPSNPSSRKRRVSALLSAQALFERFHETSFHRTPDTTGDRTTILRWNSISTVAQCVSWRRFSFPCDWSTWIQRHFKDTFHQSFCTCSWRLILGLEWHNGILLVESSRRSKYWHSSPKSSRWIGIPTCSSSLEPYHYHDRATRPISLPAF